MIESLPVYISYVFIATTFLTAFIFFRAAHFSKPAIGVILLWMLVQGVVGYNGFYTVTNTIPPRFVLLIGPPVLLIIGLFLTRPGRDFIDSLDLKMLTWLHVVRIPV